MLQDPFNKVKYDIIGDDSASTFFAINPDNGEVTLKGSVNSDVATEYKVRLRVQDGGTPPKSDVAVLSVSVQRNLNAPVFQPNQYEAAILETQNVGVPFVTVSAKDEDQRAPFNTIKFEITGEDKSKEYFLIDPDSGAIAVKKSLQLDQELKEQYTVGIHYYKCRYKVCNTHCIDKKHVVNYD